MIKPANLFVIGIILIFVPGICMGQYILNGDATKDSCNCYTLTQPINNQAGSVWQSKKINLLDSFDFSFKVFLGCITTGADGVVFILQPSSTSIGTVGEGLGFEGIPTSIGISLDTYTNPDLNDPLYDHISIQANGIVKHGNDLAGPIPASSATNNIKDCQWHTFRIKWDPSTNILSTYFDGVFRLSVQKDIVSDLFNNNPVVYWGFSGSTGGYNNLQKICTPLNPDATTGLVNNAVCIGNPVTFSDSSISYTTIQNYYWDFGDGSTSTQENPTHLYSQPGIYNVLHSITALDNCTSPLVKKVISIADNPVISLRVFDTCETFSPRTDIQSSLNTGYINQWNWMADATDSSSLQNPDFSELLPGNHLLKLTVKSNIGCKSNTASANFNIKPGPVISIDPNSGCVNIPVLFSGIQSDNVTTVTNWLWNFTANDSSNQKNTQHTYSSEGNYNVLLSAKATNGCSTSLPGTIFINAAHANAGNDTIVLANTFFQLHGSGGVDYTWAPTTGLSDPYIFNPTGNLNNDTRYFLAVKTSEGCTDTSSVKVTIFRGSAVYVPTAFTPNNDGLNDILTPYLIGIKTLNFFRIYNRWGQIVFSTNEMNNGWNGNFHGKEENNSTYVWVLRAVDEIGKVYNLKGTFVLIK